MTSRSKCRRVQDIELSENEDNYLHVTQFSSIVAAAKCCSSGAPAPALRLRTLIHHAKPKRYSQDIQIRMDIEIWP